MRSLVHIETIDKIFPIANADAIEVAQVLGWEVVIKKGEFQVGQKVAYYEIDSWVPIAQAPFLSKHNPPRELNGVPGERLRTIRLRGQVSQGLVLPLAESDKDLPIGTDLTEAYGVQKWEPPESPEDRARLAGYGAGNFPSQIPKTDQERIQNIFGKLQYQVQSGQLIDEWFAQEKLEGSSMQVAKIEDEYFVMSRNISLKIDQEGNAFVDAAKNQRILELLSVMPDLPPVFSIQGELIGTGIQGNIYKLQGHVFRIFAVWIGTRYLSISELIQFVAKARELGFDLEMVPLQGAVIKGLFGEKQTVKDILALSDGMKSNLLETQDAEGLVFYNVFNPNVTFKAISQSYLLKQK